MPRLHAKHRTEIRYAGAVGESVNEIRLVPSDNGRQQVEWSHVASRQSFLDAVALGAFTVPGDGSLDFGAIVKRLADYGYEGWFVVEAEQDPRKAPPQKMAEIGHAELMRVMTAAGYSVETEGFPKG